LGTLRIDLIWVGSLLRSGLLFELFLFSLFVFVLHDRLQCFVLE